MKKRKRPRMRGNSKSALLPHRFAKISQLEIRTLLMHLVRPRLHLWTSDSTSSGRDRLTKWIKQESNTILRSRLRNARLPLTSAVSQLERSRRMQLSLPLRDRSVPCRSNWKGWTRQERRSSGFRPWPSAEYPKLSAKTSWLALLLLPLMSKLTVRLPEIMKSL